MSPEQIDLVKRSWSKLQARRLIVGERFYRRLFKLDPGLRSLFHRDMSDQTRRLVVMLDIAVCGLDEPSVLVPIVQSMGQRHAEYGVDAAHHGTVGAALLWALGEGLTTDFTPEVEAAWTAFYGFIAEHMQAPAGAGT